MKNIRNIDKIRYPAYRETKQHSDTMFAFNVYPCTIPLDFSFVPVHWQDDAEIIYIKKGNGRVQVDSDTFEAQAGDIFLVMPGHLHGIRRSPGKSMEYENIIFNLEFLGSGVVDVCSQKFWQPLQSEKILLPSHIGEGHELYPALKGYLDATDHLCDLRPEGYELGVKGNLLMVFSHLLSGAQINEAFHYESRNMQKIRLVLQHIAEHYEDKLTVEDMADICGYSASHFMRWFKEMTGSGFNGYLIEYRLDRAAQELRSTTHTVLEVAENNGFDNLSNFNRLFKKKFEMTPSRFREGGVSTR